LELSGGPYLAECCHWLDLFEFFQSRARFTRVAAFGGLDVPNTHVDFPANAVTIIDYNTGVRGSLNFTYFTDQPEYNVWGIQGTGGQDPRRHGGRGAVRDVLGTHSGPDRL